MTRSHASIRTQLLKGAFALVAGVSLVLPVQGAFARPEKETKLSPFSTGGSGTKLSPYVSPAAARASQKKRAVTTVRAASPARQTAVSGTVPNVPTPRAQRAVSSNGSAPARPQGASGMVAPVVVVAPDQPVRFSTPADDAGDGAAFSRPTLVSPTAPPEENVRPRRLGAGWVGGRTGGGAEQPQTRPDTPGGVSTELGTGGQITVRWQDLSTNENGFRIEQQMQVSSQWQAGGTYTVGPGREMMLVSLPTGAYRFRVIAFNSGGLSAPSSWSNPVEVQDPVEPDPLPAVPTNLSAQDTGAGSVNLRWDDNSANETGFELERDPAFTGGGTRTLGANIQTYLDASGMGTFRYRVRAYNAIGPSAYSGWATIAVADTAPAAPSSLVAADGGNERDVELSWQDNADNEDSFSVQRETQIGGTWANPVTLTVAANQVFLRNAAGAGTFRYRVAALNDHGQSSWTAWTTVTVTDGWTQFTPSSDTRIIYVSSSSGNDSNNGLSEQAPKRTLAAAYALLRDGRPDWMLLKRGDTWTGEYFLNWDKNGRSATERIVLGAYGPLTQPRPILICTTRDLIYHNPANNLYFSNIAVVGLHLRGEGVGSGIFILGGGENFLVEDCYIEKFVNGITVQGDVNNGYQNIVIRRNVIVDQYSRTGHSQGMYALRIHGLRVEENVVDHNGWNEEFPDAEPTIFNHNMYLSVLCTNVSVKRNIVTRASSHGSQMRSGAQCEDNLYVQNSLALFVAINPSVVQYNVVMEGKDIADNLRRGYGIATLQVPDALLQYNIVAHKLTTAAGYAFEAGYEANFAGTPHNARFENNISYDWQGAGFSVTHPASTNYNRIEVRNNYFQIENGTIMNHVPSPMDPTRFVYDGNRYDPGSANWRIGGSYMTFANWRTASGEANAVQGALTFPDPNRTVGSYNATLGRTATFEAFIAECRQQRKGNWRREYTAPVVNQYVRDGFNMQGPP